MAKRVTMADVALAAGVHTGTASRALSTTSEHQVNPETVVRVKSAAERLGYVPNVMARGLRMSSSMAIGVIIPDLTNPFFPPIIRGIEDYLSRRGYTVLLANTDSNDLHEKAAFDSLLQRRVDGFIIATGVDEHPLMKVALANHVKVVLVNRGAGDLPYPVVESDDAQGITEAVRHLVDLGHRRIVHVAGPSNFSTSRNRADAFERACRSAEGVVGTVQHADSLSIEAGHAAVDDLLKTGHIDATAIVAANDLIALGAIRSIRSHGLRCPEDVSVVGFNDMPFAEEFTPPLTTVHVSAHKLGSEAARLLLDGIEIDVQTPVGVTLPVSLVVRSSTGPPPNLG